MDTAKSLMTVLPEVILSASGLVLLLISAWGEEKASRPVSILAVAALVAALIASLVHYGDAFDGIYVADNFSAYAKALIYVAGAASLIMAPRFLTGMNAMRPEYAVLLVFACLGMGLMVSARDMITLYIGLEMNSLAAYVLAAFARDDNRSAEAGLKYFVLGALASGILLFGITLVYGFTGSTGYETIGAALTGDLSTGALFGLVFVVAGLAFKVSAVPFHMWTPDVYEGSPTPVTAFFATAPKVAATALFIRVMLEMFGAQTAEWQPIIIFIALASILVGALGAIGQQNLKRLLAYSSINNVGFILLGLAAATPDGISAMLTYLFIYIAMTLGSFACVMLIRDHDSQAAETLGDIAGLSRTRPILAWMMMIFMFSLAGIPPMFGFWGKLVVFMAGVEAGLWPIMAIAAAASVIGAFYYLKVVKVMFFDEAKYAPSTSSFGETGLVAVAMALVVSPLGYLLIAWISPLADGAARTLF